MSPLQMAEQCALAMTEPSTLGVTLTVQKGGLPRGFPRGELLNEMERGGKIERTYSFPPMRVLAWLVANNLVTVERTGDKSMRIRAVEQP